MYHTLNKSQDDDVTAFYLGAYKPKCVNSIKI